ncbi:MAG TPA: diguanylate cyclase response regulator [Elusimicrobia bacterium]|nr:diguanylate cyclase response regulator [Elusimicrobiota bacterium]
MPDKTILVVDDDPNVGLLISAVLKKYDYSVVTLYSGAEVVDFLQNKKPDLILLDLRMPGLDGYALCKRVRENPDTRDIPIIILSGVSEVDAKVSTIELGADDFITKPFDVRELRARVNRIIKRKTSDTALNPLTRLPGSPGVEEEVHKRLDAGDAFAFLYIDADNFKSYNDVYGYAKGDEIIKYIAALLATKARQYSPKNNFIGHIGGDDFVLIVGAQEAEKTAKAVTEEFDRTIPSFYTEDDRARGFITTSDRKNKTANFQIMSLTVAVIIPKGVKHYGKIVQTAAELKHYAKNMANRRKSVYIKDRRI